MYLVYLIINLDFFSKNILISAGKTPLASILHIESRRLKDLELHVLAVSVLMCCVLGMSRVDLMTLCLGRIGVEICINGILCFYILKTNDSKRAVLFVSSEALKFRSTLLLTAH